jgi:beta-aspartyl-peptidase (threonine type)
MIGYGVAAHGGVGSPESFADGCLAACESAFILLESGKSALDAVVEAVRVLEDDGRFNAGSGSVLRLDGKTIEMDAAVMDSDRNIGIVIAVRDVKNPVLVARSVVDTPHVALAGQGATLFARKRGFPPLGRVSQFALARYENLRRLMRKGGFADKDLRWRGHDLRSLWNYEGPYDDIMSCDTVGAVAIDRKGILAVADSTGGASPMLLGRVGDSPMVGSGFYAGPSCATAATGIGEEIIRRMLAKSVYDMVSRGDDMRVACEKGTAMFPREIPVGIVGMSRGGYGISSNRPMATSVLLKER